MHEAHWGLSESPFRAWLDPKFYHAAPTHDEALSRLKFLVENRRRLGLLLAGRGGGKSLLLEVLARDLRRQACAVVRLNLLGLDPRELLWHLALQLGACPLEDDETFRLWRYLSDRLVELRFDQVPTVILLDDADQASPEVLAVVTRILHVDAAPDSRLTVVLAANRMRGARLGSRLLDLAELRIEVDRWDEPDTQAFLTAALERAGRTEPLFEARAAARLHELGQGVPRQVCQLAELALLAGAGQGLGRIDDSTVDSIYEELAVSPASIQELAFAAE